MSSKPRGNAEPRAISARAAETGEASAGNAARDEDIRRRAYEIYLERGGQPGRELDDWLQAERELEGVVLAKASEEADLPQSIKEDRHETRKFET